MGQIKLIISTVSIKKRIRTIMYIMCLIDSLKIWIFENQFARNLADELYKKLTLNFLYWYISSEEKQNFKISKYFEIF